MLSRLWQFLAVSSHRPVVSQPPPAHPDFDALGRRVDAAVQEIASNWTTITSFGAVPDEPHIYHFINSPSLWTSSTTNPYIVCTEKPTADPRTPKFAKPLAPLASWMKRADKLIEGR